MKSPAPMAERCRNRLALGDRVSRDSIFLPEADRNLVGLSLAARNEIAGRCRQSDEAAQGSQDDESGSRPLSHGAPNQETGLYGIRKQSVRPLRWLYDGGPPEFSETDRCEPREGEIKIISQNTDQEVRVNFARERAQGALLRLTANLMRVTAGAGQPQELLRQTGEFGDAVAEYETAGGDMRVGTFECGLVIDPRPWDQISDTDSLTNRILTASLRIIAARLLGNALPERTAETQLGRALDEREATLTDLRRQSAQLLKQHRPAAQQREVYEGPRGPAGTAAVWRQIEAMRKRARPMRKETEAAYLAQVERSIHRIIKRHAAQIADPVLRQKAEEAWTALFIGNSS